MKTKTVKDRKSGSRTLSIKPTKREQLEYGQAEWLAGGPCGWLADFRYRMQDGDVELYYDITGMLDLKSYLKAPLGSAQYLGILSALDEVLETCTKLGYPMSAVRCDPESVFVRPDGRPAFIFVPLSGVPAQWEASPMALLQYLGDVRHMTFVVAEDARRAEALFDYAQRNRVLSLSSYRQFLEDEFNRAPVRDGALQPAEGRTEAVASAGAPSFRMAFDPVSLLNNAPSASDVVAAQSFSDRIRGGVGEVSPTAAPAAAKPLAAKPAVAAPSGGTSLLGSASVRLAPAVPAPNPPAPRLARAYLERADGSLRCPVPAGGELVMGRSATCDVVVSGNSNISRRHASVKRTAEGLEVTDLGSSNGTFCKGARLSQGQSARIGAGDTFRLADETFVFAEEADGI